jgi:hypothetical protein
MGYKKLGLTALSNLWFGRDELEGLLTWWGEAPERPEKSSGEPMFSCGMILLGPKARRLVRRSFGILRCSGCQASEVGAVTPRVSTARRVSWRNSVGHQDFVGYPGNICGYSGASPYHE